MKLVEFPEQTVVLAKDHPEYLPFPAWTDGTTVIGLWKLTWRERLAIAFRGKIWHSIMTFGRPLQPQLLMTEYPFVTKEVDEAMRKRKLWKRWFFLKTQ